LSIALHRAWLADRAARAPLAAALKSGTSPAPLNGAPPAPPRA
jgi:hypothetical protein